MLAGLVRERSQSGQQRPVIVGFAAETDDVLRNGREKLQRKGCDLLVVNEVGDGLGFAVDHNSAVVLSNEGAEVQIRDVSKDLLAHQVWDLVSARLLSFRRAFVAPRL